MSFINKFVFSFVIATFLPYATSVEAVDLHCSVYKIGAGSVYPLVIIDYKKKYKRMGVVRVHTSASSFKSYFVMMVKKGKVTLRNSSLSSNLIISNEPKMPITIEFQTGYGRKATHRGTCNYNFARESIWEYFTHFKKSKPNTKSTTSKFIQVGSQQLKAVKLNQNKAGKLVYGKVVTGVGIIDLNLNWSIVEKYFKSNKYALSINGDVVKNASSTWLIKPDGRVCGVKKGVESCGFIYIVKTVDGENHYFVVDDIAHTLILSIEDISGSSESTESDDITITEKTDNSPSESSPKELNLNNPLHVKRYGSFLYIPTADHTAFLIGEIEKGDSRALRKLVREHPVNTIVLISPGGLLYEGIQIGNLIHDRNLGTYVPLNEECSSACAISYFAGNARTAHGKLGVHQFYSDDSDDSSVSESGTQYTVAEIIEHLEDFDTPALVYKKMFAHRKMYYFTEKEKIELAAGSALNALELQEIKYTLKYLYAFVDDNLDSEMLDEMPNFFKTRLLQLELVRIGCLVDFEAAPDYTDLVTASLEALDIKYQDTPPTFNEVYRKLNHAKNGLCY